MDVGALVASGQSTSLLTTRDEEAFIQVLDSSGQVFASSSNMTGQSPVSDERVTEGQLRIVRVKRAIPGEGESFRVAVFGVRSPAGPTIVLVGDSLESVSESTQVLATTLAIGIPILTLLVGLVSFFLTGRALRPVEAIRTEVDGIDGEISGRRVPEPETMDEISRLARTMNRMLERVEDVQHRQKQFVSDASHELRTPLTAVRASLEVGLSPDLDSELDQLIRSSLTEIGRMEQLIDDLLADAVETNGELRNVVNVDLDDLVLEEARAIRHASGVTVNVTAVSAAQAPGNHEQLRRAIRNLLNNAVRHASSQATVTLIEADGAALLTVTDDGPGIPEDQRERVFDRFVRLDAARGRDSGGAGLGLAITRRIIKAHGGRIYVDPAFTGGARFIVELPLASTT